MDKRKYITETDILDKETRIDLIMDMLDLIMKDHIEPAIVVEKISLSNNIKKEYLIRLLPDVIAEKVKVGLIE
ncbi:hypothetical protein LPC13_02850 [Clostridium celatum]|uniref:hypothetical protein n=1 Tax=Clostridium celatum TaxID=36834 RepID=UPI001F1BE49E|nr:hypothetical protein [Clostridium celatum]MCE9654212.1 hypothetical protein [Clostridium celatum]